MQRILTAISLLFAITTLAQKQPPPTPYQTRLEGFVQRKKLQENSLVRNLDFRNVGPTVMSGRITDVEVNPDDPTNFYVAYASGGLWATRNNGQSFEPLFDNEAVMSIGDIAVNWKENTVWVGTGENNSSRSSYSGVGIYRNNGSSWKHSGLPESHHIGRIILHPSDPNTLWVAVIGHLYSPNKERGVYKTIDGGKTWNQVLYIDDNTGAIDLVVDPRNPNNLYAAMWHRQRRAWNFVESGNTSGIYKSTDGGETWNRITTKESGFPTGEGVGRIGLAIYPENPNIIYASLDNQSRRKKEEKDEDEGLTKENIRPLTKEEFSKLEDGRLETFLRDNDFPKKHTAKSVKRDIEKDKLKPIALVEYLEDANRMLFDAPVTGAEMYVSEDAGKTWKKTHKDYLDDVMFSYGYYFGQVRVDPTDHTHVYIVGVPILVSQDGGKTFESINGDNVHVDHHALWVSNTKSGHLINGNDGGLNISYDDGKNWVKCNTPAVGQFYTVNVDMAKPYNVYGGLQDNGVWVGPSTYKAKVNWHQTGHYPYKMLLGGDGFQVEIDNRDNNTVYTGWQFGNYYRVDKTTGRQQRISPGHELGERPFRFNWQTPIHLSHHNQDILYMGSNRFHRSMDKGESWNHRSEDLTKGGRKGDVSYGTITSIHESPKKFGLIYVGTDDGYIHITKDAGYTWTRLSDKLPQDMWVSRVQASAHYEGTVYASLNGYRWDDLNAYLYKSTDHGTKWARIGTDLPKEPINVVKEDPNNPNIIYVGTDHGCYVSLDKGTSFMAFSKDLPAAPVHDLVIHPRDNDLILGTHGRSIYIANVEHLQQLADSITTKDIHIFALSDMKHRKSWGNSWSKWLEAKEPELEIPIYVKTTGTLNIRVYTDSTLLVNQFSFNGVKGLNYPTYDLSLSNDIKDKYLETARSKREEGDKKITLKKADNEKYYLLPGKYRIEIQLPSGKKWSCQFKITEPKRD